MKKKENQESIDALLESAKAQIEKFAKKNIRDSRGKYVAGRSQFYSRLEQYSKDIQLNILGAIYWLQRGDKADKEWENKQRDAYKKQKKRKEYYLRAQKRGKLPKVNPFQDLDYVIPTSPQHKPEDMFNTFFPRLYAALKEAKFAPLLNTAKDIVSNFYGPRHYGDNESEDKTIKRIIIRHNK